MKNEETGRISYYTSKREVVYTNLLMCENAPQEWLNVPALLYRTDFWNRLIFSAGTFSHSCGAFSHIIRLV